MRNGPQTITNGLIVALDIADRNSYSINSTSWNDLSGNGYNGVITNGPVYNGENCGSLLFDGTDDFVNLNQKFNFSQTGQFSVELVIKFSSHSDKAAAAAGIVGKGHYYDNSWDIWLWNDHKISFETTGNPTRQGLVYLNTPVLNLNTWYHYIATYNNGAKAIYLNGDPAGTQSYGGPGDFNNTNDVYIARRFGDSYRSLRGNLPLVKIYNRQLSAIEATQNFNALRGRFGL